MKSLIRNVREFYWMDIDTYELYLSKATIDTYMTKDINNVFNSVFIGTAWGQFKDGSTKYLVSIDYNIAKLVQWFNQHHLYTDFSCEGEFDRLENFYCNITAPYIAFKPDIKLPQKILTKLINLGWNLEYFDDDNTYTIRLDIEDLTNECVIVENKNCSKFEKLILFGKLSKKHEEYKLFKIHELEKALHIK